MAAEHNPQEQSSRQPASAAVDSFFHPPHEERGRSHGAPKPDPNQYLRSAKFTTADRLNENQVTLQSLILAEIFLAGGPCYIHRLWSEMFERQKSINVGMLLFTREVMRMEKQGLLQEMPHDQTAITEKGEIHLFGILLLGLIPKEALWKLEAKGVKLASTQNILDVAPQGVAGSLCGKVGDVTTDTTILPHAKASSRRLVHTPLLAGVNVASQESSALGVAIDADVPQGSQVLDVAGQGRGTAPLQSSLRAGDEGGEVPAKASPFSFPRDDRFADNISRAIDKFLPEAGVRGV